MVFMCFFAHMAVLKTIVCVYHWSLFPSVLIVFRHFIENLENSECSFVMLVYKEITLLYLQMNYDFKELK